MNAEACWGFPCHEAGSGWAAGRLHVEAVELNALARDAIDIRGANFGPVVADVAPAHIVGEDDEDIGTGGFDLGGRRLAFGRNRLRVREPNTNQRQAGEKRRQERERCRRSW